MWIVLLLILAAVGYWMLLRPPELVVAPVALDFGTARVGDTGESQRLEIANGGRRELILAEVVSDSESFVVEATPCLGLPLAARQGCGFEVSFRPQEAGPQTAQVTFDSNAWGRVPLVTLTGTGQAPSLASTPAEVDFGRIGVGKEGEGVTLTFTNRGSATLNLERVAIEGEDRGFAWLANSCSRKELAPGEGCEVRLGFRPRETGRFEGTLRVWSDAPEDPRIPVRGVGVAPGLFVDPDSLAFGEFSPSSLPSGGATEARSLTIENTGNAPLEIERVEVTGGDAAAFSVAGNQCEGATLAPGERCQVGVTYRPGAPARHRATLRVRSPSVQRRTEVALSGALLAPRIRLSTNELDFGQVVQYGTNELELTIANGGSAALALRDLRLSAGGEFGIARNDCSQQVAPGASCTLRLRFSPSRVGESDGRLAIDHNAGGTTTVALRGRAAALPAPAARVEPSTVSFEPLPVGDRSDIRTVRLLSTGAARLPLGDVSITGAQAGDFRIVPASCAGLDSLLPDSDCTVGVSFRPGGAGTRRATLVLRHGAAGGRSEVNLSGEGY